MKRLIVAAIIFILIIGSCFFTDYQLKINTNNVLDGIEKSSSLFKSEEYDECYKSLKRLESEWVKSEGILNQLVSRERLEEIGRSIALLKAYAKQKDDAGFYSSLEDIKIQISHLKNEEGFAI